MNNLPLSEAADAAASDAAFPTSSTPTPGVQETPDVPVSDLQIVPSDVGDAPIVVDAKPIAPLADLPALPQSMGLQPRQRIVLQALVAGKCIEEAARLAEINPCTVYRWRKYDARFIAAFNAWHAHSQRTARDCLIAANEYAARTVLRAAQNGDVRASLAVLKGLGTLAPQRVGPEFAKAVALKLADESDKINLSLGRSSPARRQEAAKHKLRKKQAAAKAADLAELQRLNIERLSKIPPLPRPITREAIEQCVNATDSAAITNPERCSFAITAATGDRKPLAAAVAEYDRITVEVAGSLLDMLPTRLRGLIMWDHAEAWAQKFESLGATVELRPGWRQ